jgi:prepilin-type N-terminal cleavage/methylation domain-containing protein/prepilin-type processing-associated H-X9-DG protein
MFRSSRAARRGFTLIELLVVIAIIAILIGLLLPAVQKVREAAARTKCTNNLKQMGLACQMYQDTYGILPPGWLVTPGSTPSPGWSWATLILPYIEQANLYQQLGVVPSPANGPPAANATLQTPIATYRCPSDSGPSINSSLNNYGMCNYVCNRSLLGPDNNSNAIPITVQTIPDGSSNTIVLGERDFIRNIGATWVRANQTSASFEGRPGSSLNPLNPANPPSTGTGNNQRLAFNSMHTNGCNFVFADGSVHFLTNSTPCDPADNWNFPINQTNFLMQNLCNPADGNVVTLP